MDRDLGANKSRLKILKKRKADIVAEEQPLVVERIAAQEREQEREQEQLQLALDAAQTDKKQVDDRVSAFKREWEALEHNDAPREEQEAALLKYTSSEKWETGTPAKQKVEELQRQINLKSSTKIRASEVLNDLWKLTTTA